MTGVAYNVGLPETRVSHALAKLRAVTSDLRPVLDDIGDDIAQRVRLLFRDGKDPFGAKWKPLKFRQGHPLLDTGTHLRNSITHQAEGPNAVAIGTTFKYAHVHMFGATIVPKAGKRLVFRPRGFAHPIFAKKVVIPPRPFLPIGRLPDEWRRDVQAIIRDHLDDAMKKAS